ncbi:MAG: hypothetical protein BHW02_01360 [Clostridium sp. 28_12]|jgi:signal transduction histidine kinase regulating citrate/malate metabolism|nr:MAG: hypothetical protein BHW02_01360 [Clostridium sp. 28_12]
MTHLLNNIVANFDWASVAYFVATIIENYLFLNLFLLICDEKFSLKHKLLYLVSIVTISKLTSLFVPSPFNVIINYTCVYFLVRMIFKISIIKGITSTIITSFVFGLINILIQNPYLTLLKLSSEEFMKDPKYRITYLMIFYCFISCIIIFFHNFRNLKIRLDILDNLDKKTVIILCLNLVAGFFTLIVQLIITAYYLEALPIIITIMNFILLVTFLMLSIFGFKRVINLSTTKRDLEYAEQYNKSLEILYLKVKGFKHDFDSIVSSLNGYIEQNDMDGLKQYFSEVKKDCKIADDLALINPRTINNPGIYSLLNNEYAKASALGINFELEFFLNLNELEINIYFFSRILGVLLDNAIEAAENSKEKFVKISFIRENVNGRAVITIENSYSNKNIDLENIFKKGITSKEYHAGLGLWEVKRYVNKSKNLDLKPSVSPSTFKQEFFIYDL